MKAVTVISILVFSAIAGAQEAPAPDVRALEQRIDDLEQQHRILARQLELADEKRAEKEKDTPVVTFGRDGFVFRTPDGKSALKLHALLQVDGRTFFGDDKNLIPDTFLLRRARPILDATFFGWLDVRIMPDFGQNTVKIFDAYLDVHPWPWLRLRAGKFKPPVGLERLESASAIKFNERAFPTALVPNRDVGAMLWGDVANGTFSWFLGVFNGVADGQDNPDVDLHDGKDFAGRIFLHPFRPLKNEWLNNLGLGFAGTYGKERGTLTAPNLVAFKTPGQINFVSFLVDPTKTDGSGTDIANGDRWRISPQGYWYGGPLGVLVEYVRSSNDVRRGANHGAVVFQAWQVQLSALLTPGDKASYDNVLPKHPLEYKQHGYGAFELVARYHEILVGVDGDATFPTYLDPNKSAHGARAFGVGLNWWANAFFRASVDYDHANFTGGAKGGDRAPEDALLGRLQAMW